MIFSDPELINEIYVTKNKYFDKHHFGHNIFKRIVGESILFSKSTDLYV
jgi:cytochrome P450